MLGATYAWASPTYINEYMSIPDISEYIDEIPYLEGRRHYSNAALKAQLINMMGGYSEGDSKESIKPELTATAEKELPYFARMDDEEHGISQEAARDWHEHQKNIPSWALQLISPQQIERAMT